MTRPTGLIFYPNSSDLQTAHPVVLDFDQPEAQLDMVLSWAPNTKLDVTFYSGQTNQPCRTCSWHLSRVEAGLRYDIARGTANRLPGFTLGGLPPGQYRVVVEDQTGAGWYATADAIVVEGRPTELTIATRPGIKIAGRVVIENASQDDLRQLQEQKPAIGFYLQWTGEHMLPTRVDTNAALDLDRLEFEIGPLPPQAYTLAITQIAGSGYLAGISQQGRPLDSPLLDLETPGAWDRLEVRIGFDEAQVRLRPSSRPQTEDSSSPHLIVLLPDPETNRFGRYHRTYCSSETPCLMNGIAPGRYLAFEVSAAAADELTLGDPGLAARVATWATEVTLVPGENPAFAVPRIPANVERELILPAGMR